MSITKIFCKDCGEPFHYASHAASSDRLAGRSVPERCGTCRNLHRREYSVLGVSHSEVLQLRTNGYGGLSSYIRERKSPVKMDTQKSDRDPLPIEGIIDELIDKVLHSKKRVHLVVGPTGSGKSTWLPLKLVSCKELIRKGTICVTQPRIPATEGPSSYIGFLYYGPEVEPSVGQGLIVGYRHSMVGTRMTDAANRLIFMTDGTLLNEVKNNDLQKYCVIMIDEAHERSVNIDTIMALLKEKLSLFMDLRVIIASATVDAEKFVNYFGGPEHVEQYYSKGFTYPILELFSDESVIHWPGGQVPMAGETSAPLWKELDKEVVDSKWLGPTPCYNFNPFGEKYRLRYYPQFESLVFQGKMADSEEKTLRQLNNEDGWQNAINTLYRESQREINISDTEVVSIDKSIRGNLPARQHNPKFYKNVDTNLKNRLVYGAVDTICRLVRRDEIEAKHRYERWQNRKKYGWGKLEKPKSTGHILAFFPTSSTIEFCADILKKRLPDLPGNNEVFIYQRELSEEEKNRVTEKNSPDSKLRKIILGTNLAETSLTLDGLVYVVDTGLILQPFYNPEVKGMDYPTILHSHAGCRQRLGRVGRKEPGEGYRLYTREELKAHPAYTTPEVTRSDPSQLILNLVSAGLPPSFIQKEGALMQPPNTAWIDDKLKDLKQMGAIDKDDDLTLRGAELTRIPENNLWNAVLLCEADRFGCLWEMAIFLCFIGLNDSIGPDNQSKWLTLWVPDQRRVFEDNLEEKLEAFLEQGLFDEKDEVDDDERKASSSDTIWTNPYVQASALIKQQALRGGCLDDLELYLRIWQGWIGQGDNLEKRLAWAGNHGISAEALMRVERSLGLDTKDTSESGMLRHFWAFGQKGIMKRDIHFEALDKVRYLYAAANHDNHFSVTPDGKINSCNTIKHIPDPRKPLEIKFEPESVWFSPDLNYPMRFDKAAELDHLVASVTIKPRKKKTLKTLRHVIWLNPAWVKDGIPGLYDNPVHLAKIFSKSADEYRTHYGRQPFARGEALSGLPWSMPHFPIPSDVEIQQWRVRYSEGEINKTPYPAIFQHSIPWPENIKPIGFVQLISGPLLPMKFEKSNPGKESLRSGDTIMVVLKYDKTSQCLWAVQVKPAKMGIESNVQSEEKKNQPVRNVEMDGNMPQPEHISLPEEPTPKEEKTPAKVIARIVPAPPPKPIDLQEQFSANSVIVAEFINCTPKGDMAWVTVSVPISAKQKKNWSFPVHKRVNLNQFNNIPSGKKCRIRIKAWKKIKGQLKPWVEFVEWL